MNNVLQVKDVSFSFQSATVFENISFAVQKNEIVALLGKSGSGKSTLLNLISNIIPAQNGSIKMVEIPGMQNIAYLMQTPILQFYRTAIENALLGVEITKQKNLQKIADVSNFFKVFKLSESENKFPGELSGGMKQRVGIIQTICIDSQLYLLDEPFNAIDNYTCSIIQEHLFSYIKNRKASAILVTHDLEQALLCSDRIFMLHPYGILEYVVNNKMRELGPSARKLHDSFGRNLYDLVKMYSEI